MNTSKNTESRLCRLHAMKQAQLAQLQNQPDTLIHRVLSAEADAILRAIKQLAS